MDFVFVGLELEIAALDPESSVHLHGSRAAIVFRLLAARSAGNLKKKETAGSNSLLSYSVGSRIRN